MSNQGSPTDAPRHWRGPAGNRHEHHNVWVIGGPRQTYRPEPAYTSTTNTTNSSSATDTANMNARRDSAASAASAASGASAAANTNANAGANVGERRRSSASSGGSGLFYSLSNQKRSMGDPTLAARRASWAEQAQKGNFLSQWWNGYTKGP
ncbi:hypothetical protein PHISCL_08735 [Aspergillus sclerotialis]|uniref:Uncharacterized protein n=1 Tax=Aspergillus sclerotialis TaxID=2070753 RepID=A0A3A2Z9N2_9EURO|nr:hypothetical protein PHISCL_08735 [Aspergillus sclerotialis]